MREELLRKHVSLLTVKLVSQKYHFPTFTYTKKSLKAFKIIFLTQYHLCLRGAKQKKSHAVNEFTHNSPAVPVLRQSFRWDKDVWTTKIRYVSTIKRYFLQQIHPDSFCVFRRKSKRNTTAFKMLSIFDNTGHLITHFLMWTFTQCPTVTQSEMVWKISTQHLSQHAPKLHS